MEKENNTSKKKGITLLSLVITVILLLILAGITCSLIIGENGLLKRTQYAKSEYQNAINKEKSDLDNLYSSMMVATGDDAKITISMEELDKLIDSKVEEKINTNKKSSPILLTQIFLPSSGTSVRKAGSYKASSNLYTKNNKEAINDYLQYEENKGWTVLKEGFYFITARSAHEVWDDKVEVAITRILLNNASLSELSAGQTRTF